MAVNITIPSPGESISEVVLGPWHKSSGEWVNKDDVLVEIESDKVTMELPSPESGVLNISAEEGAELEVGDTIGTVDPDAEPSAGGGEKKESAKSAEAGAAGNGAAGSTSAATKTEDRAGEAGGDEEDEGAEGDGRDHRATPVARKVAADRGIDLADVKGTGPSGRIRKSDVLAAADKASDQPSRDGQAAAPAEEKSSDAQQAEAGAAQQAPAGSRNSRTEKMTKLRRRIAERLVDAQQTAAMLTTFNEADMSAVLSLRKQWKDSFSEKHGINLGFMSFFASACVSALQKFPRVNAYVVDDSIEFHDFVDISVAVGTERGLVVPVVRNVESMSFAEIELAIKDLAIKARDGKLTMEDMTGGTFTITNGGIFGSLNSTPILNPPQSGILGMHSIKNRPVEDPDSPGQIAMRPMMNLALSYDHRIVDGAEAVGFLVRVKECIEHPERMLLDV